MTHVFVVADGGGEMRVDGRVVPFGPAILTVPAGVVHGFRFVEGTVGQVITIAEPLIRAVSAGHERLGRLCGATTLSRLEDPSALDPILAALAVETESAAPLAGLASETLLRMLLIAASRLIPCATRADAAPPGRPALLVSRYRAQVDLHLRETMSVSDHARRLGTSTPRLRAACVAVAGMAPIRMIHERLLAEARRQLSYTDRTVSEIAYDLGFEDPAYFSRFFRRGAGVSPARWRTAQSGQDAVAG